MPRMALPRGLCASVSVAVALSAVLTCVDSDQQSSCSNTQSCAWERPVPATGLSLMQHTKRFEALAIKEPFQITVEVNTSMDPYAWTETGAAVAFKAGGEWTHDEVLCTKALRGQLVVKTFEVPEWPTELRLTALGSDAWGYGKILLRYGKYVITVLDSKGAADYGEGSVHWVDANEEAPESNTYQVSSIPTDHTITEREEPVHSVGEGEREEVNTTNITNATNATNVTQANGTCLTRYDPRATAVGYDTSAPGTACVFGVDQRDEGAHCILDSSEYGSYGWCYTSADKSSFGSCGEGCPLFGPLKVLGEKVDALREALENATVVSTNTSNVTVTITNITVVANATKNGTNSSGKTHKEITDDDINPFASDDDASDDDASDNDASDDDDDATGKNSSKSEKSSDKSDEASSGKSDESSSDDKSSSDKSSSDNQSSDDKSSSDDKASSSDKTSGKSDEKASSKGKSD